MKTIHNTKFKETEIGLIPKGWRITTVGQFGKVITGKTPSRENPDDWGEDFDFITPTDIISNEKYLNIILRKISQTGFNHFKNMIIPANSIVVTCIGSDMGKVVMNKKTSLTNQQINSIIVSEDFNNDYVYYCMKYLYPVLWEHSGGGSTMPIINKSTFESIEVSIPESKDEQKEIAEILSSLDDKIELNRKINANLEKMASSLFKQWFVDIGDKLPDGWIIEKIGNLDLKITDYVANGSFASLKENVSRIYESEEYALFMRNTDLKNKFTSKRYVDKKAYDFLSKTHLKGGEVIISNVADVGSVYLCPKLKIPMVLGNNVIMLDGKLLNNYLYLFFTSRVGQDAIGSITSGSAQLKFNKTDFRNLEIIIPDNETLKKFNEICEGIFQVIQNNENEINNLIIVRDSLLPQLMSGKIRVKI